MTAADFNRLEFHRNAVALMPDPADRRPGIAFQVDGGTKKMDQQFCSCRTSGAPTCSHQKELSRVLAARQGEPADRIFYDNFQTGLWHRLAAVLAEEERETPATIRLADEVVFVDQKKVVAHGRHEELLESTPGYGRLVQAYEEDAIRLSQEAS